ncbi:hypothetical protein QFZ34_001856 [Phyllobacterium ifriqiyense]|uniref:Polysaccharide biosynthesis enzyme WcbI domain-containing protein n=1 Tax=Phyllobacterium ifriqiyense TaxID=314238 RepID=A0ABU0S7G1_9HYPH|nr:WcbI family polysaccharide biosynthesis putative acetyltransferase [Phyllobacterium ifriqiyense]MDQ0996674.1 hypothetical protein [Phyllobacterium ifriqiyense]
MEKWLLISNCNTYGLANSLKLLSNSFTLDCFDVFELMKNLEKYKETMPGYDRVIINPAIQFVEYDFSLLKNVSRIPGIDFDAYHPDLCYLFADGQRIYGPTAGYHSMLVFAAFEAGYSVEKTERLFRREIFEQCGFLSRWEPERDRLMKVFSFFNLDIAAPFRSWSRGQSFMYGLGHPKAGPIHDVARVFLESIGIETNKSDLVPHDTLVDGICLPVYPEIAETFGFRGSRMFKVLGEYRLMSLEEFIQKSFEVYSKWAPGEVAAEYFFADRYNHVKNIIAEADK